MALSAAPPRLGNLPAELTTFVGRRHELAEVRRLLAASRLVTLTGVGGAGKTRLALRAANDARRGFQDGVWFVDLASVADPSLLPPVVSATLGLLDQVVDRAAERLAEYLRDKQLLLVFDNCDHLRDPCAVLAGRLLSQSPGLHVLATSRQTLGVTGEHVYPVPPMTLPPGDPAVSLETAAVSEAVALFVDRARAVRPSFALTEDSVAASVAVCRRLDGIPLAIELAAARLSALSVEELLERLQDRYRLLVGGSTSALPRHQTLRELVGWSWNLCTEHERTIWSDAAIFRSGFDLAAAEAVCADNEVAREEVLDVLTALAQKSVLTPHENRGRVRYHMLDTLQQFGQEQLQGTGRRGAVLERHRAHYAEMASQAYAVRFGQHQREWLERLQLELANLRVALDTSFGKPSAVDSGLELAADLWFFWAASGRANEGRQWLDRGLRLARASTPIRTRAMEFYAYLCLMQDDLVAARPMVAEARTAAQSQADARNLAWVTQLRAMVALSEGDLAAAQPLFVEALAAHRDNRDQIGAADTSTMLALVNVLLMRLSEAEKVCRDAIATCESHGERWLKTYLIWDLGLAAWRGGNSDESRVYAREALRLARDLDEPIAISLCLELLAWNLDAGTDAALAVRLLGAVRSVLQSVGWGRNGVPVFGSAGLTKFHDDCLVRLHDRLAPSEIDAAFEEGAAMTRERIIAAALGETAPRASRVTHARNAEPGMLTRRELEVADLVAQGLSNKDIAATLVISQRTAEAHVEKILTKLGFTSRARIAAWMVEHRGAQPPS